jgi:ankyrin repeat protein
MNAIWKGHLKIAQLLVERGANVNAAMRHGCTALIWASRNGYLEIAQLLVEWGANVNASCCWFYEYEYQCGLTALMYASDRGHFEIFKFLVEKGADVNAETSEYKLLFNIKIENTTALTIARKFDKDSIINENRLEIVKFIAEREEKTVINNVCDFIKRHMSSYFYTNISVRKDD